ncbi:MAG: hypothetical protein IJ731_09420 [Eubacterium sp.]|nr:hypothetical protein [Eubacterium sp.]
MNFIKKIIKKLKLFVLFFVRIVFAKNHFKVPFYKKISANLFGGYLADQYALYDFDHNDRHEYLSEFDWYKSRYINEPFDFMLNNKVVCNLVLGQYVRVAKTYAVKNKKKITSENDAVSSYEEIIALLKKEKMLIVKPFSRGKGIGVYLLRYEDERFYIGFDESSESEIISLLKKRDNWMLCEYIRQHKYLNDIFDKTANTIRLITLRDPKTQKIKIFFAVQRIGTSKTVPVDNGSEGALISKIDLETGELSQARTLHTHNVYEYHPDTNAPIKGVVVPQWSKIKEEILCLANKVPFMNFVAWDILVTDDSICIIEANTSSGVNIIQLWGGQRNGELGEFYRYHKVIKK